MNRVQWGLALLAAFGIGAVIRWVDLSPRVEGDFFFSRDDPQLRESLEIERLFAPNAQIIVRAAAPDIHARAYRDRISTLGDTLRTVPGVVAVTSLANADAFHGPLWSRVLQSPAGDATNLVVDIDTEDRAALVDGVEAVVERFRGPGLDLVISGVPFVVEKIRRHLFRDLIVFSTSALVVFGLATAFVYRRVRIVVGTLATCLLAVGTTLALNDVLGIGVGLLTANLATIVFVLTLSHIVFLISNWRRLHPNHPAGTIVGAAVSETLVASFWCMTTTLLGFLSLLLASARPLRQLGMAGALGTAVAIGAAYLVFPRFLDGAVPPGAVGPPRMARWLPTRGRAGWLGGMLIVGVVLGVGVTRLSTDPSLLSYFAKTDPLRQGLEAIDRDGGSSPLNLVVRDPGGATLDRDAVVQRMADLEETLERDPDVGMVLSPAVFLQQARRAPFLGNLTWSQLLDVPPVARLAAGFIRPERDRGLFFLRMHEAGRTESRRAVERRLTEAVGAAGLDLVLAGGLYRLQGQLGVLIRSSLRLGLTGLLILFLLIAAGLSRSVRTTTAMVAALALIPLVVLGAFGWSGTAIDIISSPAANVALAMGVDSMIHLIIRVRRLEGEGTPARLAWWTARLQLGGPIAGATVIICTGFGLFALSSFPPTQRFGLAVILGTLTAATMALAGLPMLEGVGSKAESPGPGPGDTT